MSVNFPRTGKRTLRKQERKQGLCGSIFASQEKRVWDPWGEIGSNRLWMSPEMDFQGRFYEGGGTPKREKLEIDVAGTLNFSGGEQNPGRGTDGSRKKDVAGEGSERIVGAYWAPKKE